MQITNIFLDRDGTIIEDKHYLCSPEKISFIPGALQILRSMVEHGLKIFLVTNQSGIGRQYFTEFQYFEVHNQLLNLLKQYGIELTGSTYCPHRPDDNCPCRKPETGMWTALAEKHKLDCEQSIIIGDKVSDIDMGYNAGFKSGILVLTGHGKKALSHYNAVYNKDKWYYLRQDQNFPIIAAQDLGDAWNWIRSRYE
ncbi:D-glycero-alpha-D-manno-heptose-1,7-bisphosphate 7-phosphatase [Desulfonatronovibrio magnus]|uniref:D-glycero-alpha-D-manno-heptose-1,7-bisphosphate 7-phosphatase n=1 Tax=Desulfonatronovibrio magnus TaxID=698827 RepID=UPI0005EADD7B|nr:HAD family hydrolase [Desulfonatronovibrio magnus]